MILQLQEKVLHAQSKQNSAPIPSSKNNYHFIDLIRFVSIIGITSLHSIYFGLPQFVQVEDYLNQTDHPLVLIIFLQLMRFSVISFCMISGFLLAGKAENENWVKLFTGRIKVTVPPYLVALVLTVFYWYIRAIFKHEENNSVFTIVLEQLLTSPFWYIPSNLLSLLLILILLKRLPSVYVGGLLFVLLTFVTIKYVYYSHLPHTHPIFFMAFSFYIWLGGIFWKHNLASYIKTIDKRVVLIVWFFTFIISVIETSKSYNTLGLNNLKIFNQIYAVISFIAIIKFSNSVKPFTKLNPRKETYGIYLYSPLVGLITGVVMHKVVGYFDSYSALSSIAYTLLHFSTTFIATTITVKLMLKYKILFLGKG